ncbi:cytochrome c oxidase subunit 2 [Dyella jiangningensis]|uniref:cytochrome c oxidase subunit II n=2 Tax=Gammaproteobacteria TaxID=1236 RepID=UPI00087E28FE|nr:cytochrome c oxidase subunit II [Dyella sp. AtDHG13]PXV55845.1 cytochrome c oxidase subunit 2 [Dyella sp. AtDHG13]SDK54233.1 cytochrome c oxidase subunit 2 [Dyella jiangningensis]
MISPLPQASSLAPGIDALFNAMLALSAAVALAVFAAMLVFCVRYRRGSAADRSLSPSRSLGIELTWTLVPLALFMGLFGWSIGLWQRLQTPPADATVIYVVAKQWMWKTQHPNGQREIDALHVPLGQPVRLVMTSEDVIHSFYVPAFRVKQDVLPGRYTQLWFTATRPGRFPLFCAEFCGTDHAVMRGDIVVMPSAQYAQWLQQHASQTLATRGGELFRQLGCSGCHGSQSTVHAPDLMGLYGHTVALSDGSRVIADDRYLHDSIMLPSLQIVAGYAPIMPSYQGRIGEEDVLALLAYIKSTTPEPAHEQH